LRASIRTDSLRLGRMGLREDAERVVEQQAEKARELAERE
jgi:hypothetical protein